VGTKTFLGGGLLGEWHDKRISYRVPSPFFHRSSVGVDLSAFWRTLSSEDFHFNESN